MSDDDGELIGRTLGGRFRILELLGEGSMAAVYRAEQDREPREVAVKVMHAQLLLDPTFAKRFAREAKTAARITHPNSVRILEHGVDGKNLYLAMELLRGQDLFDLIYRERRVPQTRAASILMQICDAMTAAHGYGIIHRDLKPENVMIMTDPTNPNVDVVKVLDFGIAKILDRDADAPASSRPIESSPPSSALTRVGGLIGTPEYMSPEQAMALPVDARSDVYACGALLFHTITGRAPFLGKHPLEVLMQIPEAPPPVPSSIVATIHPEMDRIILKALSKGPEQRHQTARELAEDLRVFLVRAARDGGASGNHTVLREEMSRAGHTPLNARKIPTHGGLPGLPGVPDHVVIQEPEPISDPFSLVELSAHPRTGDAPPDTQRSPALSPEDAAREAATSVESLSPLTISTLEPPEPLEPFELAASTTASPRAPFLGLCLGDPRPRGRAQRPDEEQALAPTHRATVGPLAGGRRPRGDPVVGPISPARLSAISKPPRAPHA